VSLPKIERSLGAQRLAQYVTRGRCERFLRISLFPSEADAYAKRFRISFEPLSPLLSEEGQLFEREQVRALTAREHVVDMTNRPPADLVTEVQAQPIGRAFYYQPKLQGHIGPWPCEGRADLIGITRALDGSVDAVVIDIKASRRETVGYRLQVAFYARLLRDTLDGAGVPALAISGAIVSRDADVAAELEHFDLALYDDELERLVGTADSDVARIAGGTFASARYHLNPACDSCAFNALCFLESAEREDLSLVPQLSPAEKRALQIEGVVSARDLALLMDYGDAGMAPAPDREADVERIGARWPLGSRLPALVQRARAAVHERDRTVESKRYLLGSDFGSLPDTEQYPDLVRVFVDAQRDYLEDRLYLVAGHVVGQAGEYDVVEMTTGPPNTDDERALLVAWVQKILPAIARAAGAPSAPLHVYLWDRRGQRALLGALERHFDALCAIPAFHDLLTSSPALSQAMLSFLGDEARARLNLGAISQNLYQVAQAVGFRWQDGETDLRRAFRARAFDNRRPYERDAGTGALWAADGDGAEVMWLESGARFGTEIPLEYAYAAWDKLPEAPDLAESARAQVRGFLDTTVEQIAAFARLRCRALRHVEENFKYKNRRVEKQPLELDQLDRVDVDQVEMPLSRALESFLLLEHHAARQEALLRLALPPHLRAQTGRSAILRCESFEKTGRASFSFADARGERVVMADVGTLKFREDSWVVLNPIADEVDGAPLAAWRLVRGRLGVVARIDAERLSIRMLGMNFKDSAFRYRHQLFKPEPGALYTLDEMVDDLNADKFLEACRNARANALYRWLEGPEEGKRPRTIRPARLRAGTEMAELAARAQAPDGLTPAQRAIVGESFADRILVVQGPPGTGKSHTLGFAILARALALATPARPFRVAVAARTHAATTIALESVARRARQLASAHAGDARLAPLASLKVVKVCVDAGDAVSEGVERLLTEGSEEFRATEQWDMLLAEPLLVVGGTPGGLYNLIKRGQSRRGGIDWSQAYFDLVVIDEASQMGIAEALTAAAFLREDGQFIAIGDHRQMPPILAHAWDRESRRELQRARPHLAIFDYLRALGFASAALDQSFRIPSEVADFLQRHVYAEDGIDFRSTNRERIDSVPGLDGWLGAALAPEHAFVVVEHDEAGSQQANLFEAELVGELARVAAEELGLEAGRGIGVVVPHGAQRSLLRARLPWMADAIDTVERFQGGERDLIIVSATVSDREYAMQESSFLLEPRRLTVAISRPRRKLVVIASRSVFDLIPSDLDEYERGALWKHVRHECGRRTLWEGEVGGHRVTVRALGEGDG
jgi:hypothetical protein